jgi:hypothetical protein
MIGEILRYRRGAIVAIFCLFALVAAQMPVPVALVAAIGAGTLAEILPSSINQYGWAKTGSALVAIVLLTTVTLYFALSHH